MAEFFPPCFTFYITKYKNMKLFFLSICLFFVHSLIAQFAPPAGMPGSTAIPADSSIFVAWATDIEVERGWQYIIDENMGKAEVGEPAAALGMADSPSIVSLGDGGFATLTFDLPIRNGEGYDFAVFENSFDGAFLELAFVEVSSDGENFVRFPAISNTQADEDIGSFGWIDATKINNLAGKYQELYGTPFDLEELVGNDDLDVENITHVRIVDVVGSTDENYATFDQNGQAINDPFPTPFPSGGFDLDAVGVIHQNQVIANESIDNQKVTISVFPNPVRKGAFFQMKMDKHDNFKYEVFQLFDAFGKNVEILFENGRFSTKNLSTGCYFLKGAINGQLFTKRIVVLD